MLPLSLVVFLTLGRYHGGYKSMESDSPIAVRTSVPAGDDFTPLNRKEIRLKNATSGSSFGFLRPSLFSIDEHRMVLQI